MEKMLTAKPTLGAEVNARGDLVIPHDVAERFGLAPGARVRLEDETNHVRLHRPVAAAIYGIPMKRTVWAIPSPPAAAACGRKG